MKKIRYHFVNALIGFILFSGAYLLTVQLYYEFTPASNFINYYHVKADNSKVGEPVNLQICRVAKTTIKPIAVRSFILKEPNHNTVSDYYFQPNIQKGNECSEIQIGIDRQPQKPGKYFIRTDLVFEVRGVEKQISFDSNDYYYGAKR